jgi:CrcB protein
MLNVIYVAIGGALGASLRYMISNVLQNQSFPYATLTVNLLGSLAIGLCMGWLSSLSDMPVKMQLLLVTGILGGFTTFSSFAYENLQMIEKGMYWPFVFYVLVSNVGGIVLAFVGFKATVNQINI